MAETGPVRPATPEPASTPAAGRCDEVMHVPRDFDAIYRAHFHMVHRWVRYMGSAPQDAEDLTQQVFEIVLDQWTRFDGRSLKGWLYAITRKTVAGYRRRAWFRCWLRRDDNSLVLVAPCAEGGEQTLARKRIVERALSRMSEKLRTTFILHEIEGHTAEEIAEIQSIPVNTVHSRLRLARQRFLSLCRQMDPEEDR